MKHLSFELTMPNVGSWNGKWTGSDKKYYIAKSISDKFFKSDIEPLLEKENKANFYYNFGDGWGANVKMEIVTAQENRVRIKNSKGFSGYDWMVKSIILTGNIQLLKKI